MLPFLFGIPTYTICVILGAGVGIWLFMRRMPKERRRAAVWLICAVAPGAFIGAKALYFIALPEGAPPPDSFLTGFVFHGGLIGGMLAGLAAARLLQLPILRTMDAAVPALCIGHGIGRIGCFCAGCCYGRAGVPVQLMEAAGLFALGAWLLRGVHPAREEGALTALYGLIYGAMRFLLEFLRADEIRGVAWGLSTGQWLSLVLMLGGLLLLMRTSRIVLTVRNLHLTIDNRFLGGVVRIRFDAFIERGLDGKAKLRLRLAGKELSMGGSRRTQFHFLDALPELKLHVRQLRVHILLGIPDDAALLAQVTGALRAALNTAGAYLLAKEEIRPELALCVEADDRRSRLEVFAQTVLAFRTMDALRAVLRTIRRQKKKDG